MTNDRIAASRRRIGLRAWDMVTFGETMLRLNAPGFGRLEEATTLDVRIGGSESNTAVALARLGKRVAWWSRLPANPLGRRIENEIRRWGVDTSGVMWDSKDEARAGLYFLDFGVPPRGIDVYYDRARSSITTVRPDHIDLSRIEESHLLHLSGITPALSESCGETVRFMMQMAEQYGTQISFDVNYRAKLWTPDEAKRTLAPLLPMVDVLLCPLADAQSVFGITGTGPEVARAFRDKYGVGAAVITMGGGGSVACDDANDFAATPFALGQVVDRVGAGDAFNAGVLWGWLQDDLKLGLETGTAMAALKHTVPGDLLLSTKEEIEAARSQTFTGIRR